MVIKLNPEKYYYEQYPEFFSKLGYQDPFEWECILCGQLHEETEFRNYQRRKIKCNCQYNKERVKEIDKELSKIGYTFLYNDKNAYELTNKGCINLKHPIKVQCNRCKKISYELYYNIRNKHKKCNCDIDKKFTRDITTEEFIQKWPELNQKNFELLPNQKYIGRNAQYKIKCKNCGHEDIRWGITLIDSEILCKYCDSGSKNEQLISMILDQKNIKYIREYIVSYNNHQHRFDFFLPDYNSIIEYNGQQHYMPIEYFGGEKGFKNRVERDKEKVSYCKENNLNLIIFKYDQTSQEIKEKIGSIFNDQVINNRTLQAFGNGNGAEKDIV